LKLDFAYSLLPIAYCLLPIALTLDPRSYRNSVCENSVK
jgi:hypothetical protein